MTKTIIFEEKYKTNINKFSSTDQITDFLEVKLNKRLKVISLNQNLVSNRGNTFPLNNTDIDAELDKALQINSNKAVKLSNKLKSIR
jgi:hypothetical protein